MATFFEDTVSNIPVVLPTIRRLPAYTPTFGAAVTPPTKGTIAFEKAKCTQIGADLEIDYQIRQTAAGSAGSGAYYWPLPPGCTIDLTQVETGQIKGSSGYAFNGTTEYEVVVGVLNATTLRFSIFTSATATVSLSNGNVSFANATMQLSFSVKLPIVEFATTEYTAYGAGLATSVKPGLVANAIPPTALVSTDFTNLANCAIDAGDVVAGANKYMMTNNMVTLWLFFNNMSISASQQNFNFTLPAGVPRPPAIFATSCNVYDTSGSVPSASEIIISTLGVVTVSKSGGPFIGGSNNCVLRACLSWPIV